MGTNNKIGGKNKDLWKQYQGIISKEYIVDDLKESEKSKVKLGWNEEHY